jgi:hypothetical protein
MNVCLLYSFLYNNDDSCFCQAVFPEILKFCHKEVGRKTAVGLACFRRGGRGKEKTGGRRALEFKEYKSL